MNFPTEVTKREDMDPEGKRAKQAIRKANGNRTKVSAAVWGEVTTGKRKQFCTVLSEIEPEGRSRETGPNSPRPFPWMQARSPAEMSLPSLLLYWVFIAAVSRR